MAKKNKLKKYQFAGNMDEPIVNSIGSPFSTQSNIPSIDELNMYLAQMIGASESQPSYPNINAVENITPFVSRDVLSSDWNLDSDGKYRKNVYTEDKRFLEYSDGFKLFNTGLDITRLIANRINDSKTSREEREKYIKAIKGKSRYNINEGGINNIPVYFQYGGSKKDNMGKKYTIKKFATGGQDEVMQLLQMYAEMTNTPVEEIIKQFQGLKSEEQQKVLQEIYNQVSNAQQSQPKMQEGGRFAPTVSDGIVINYLEHDDNTGLTPQQIAALSAPPTYYQEPVTSGNKRAGRKTEKLYLDNYRMSSDNPEGIMKATYLGRTYFNNKYDKNSYLNSIDNPVLPFIFTNDSNTINNRYYFNSQEAKDKYLRRFQTGGVPEVTSDNSGFNQVELEQGEVFQKTDGQIKKVSEKENRHEKGGSIQTDVDRVLEDTADKRKDIKSKLLKITPEEADALVNFTPKRSVTHSKLYELASDYFTKKVKKLEKIIEDNLEYLSKTSDVYAQNSLDENLKLLSEIPTNQELFDTIFNHQEYVKQRNNIPTGTTKKQTGGGRDDLKWFTEKWGLYEKGNGKPYKNKPKGYKNEEYIKDLMTVLNTITGSNYPTSMEGLAQMRTEQEQKYKDYIEDSAKRDYWNYNATTETGYSDPTRPWYDGIGVMSQPMTFESPEEFEEWKQKTGWVNLDNRLDKGFYVDPITGRYIGVDVKIGIPKMNNVLTNPTQSAPTADLLDLGSNTQVSENSSTEDPSLTSNNTENNNKFKPTGTQPSKFNEPLRWFDVAGDLLGLIDRERTPVDLQQFERQPLNVRELNALPTLLQNQGDLNAVLEQLPTNGVGFANAANMLANKYKINNEVLGQYENQNKLRRDEVDRYNDANAMNIEQANAQLRDQFLNRILQGREIQRQQRMKSLNDLFTKIEQNRKLNREGDLVLSLTPYFNQYAQFNEQGFDLEGTVSALNNSTANLGITHDIVENSDGSYTQIMKDKDGKIIKTTKIPKSALTQKK